MQEKIERNKKIYKEWLKGKGYTQIAKDFGLGTEVVFRIIKRYKEKES